MGRGPNPWLDPATRPARRVVWSPLAGWISDHWDSGGEQRRLLDYGCGDLLSARLLPPTMTIDGYDPAPGARVEARQTLAEIGSAGQVFEHRADVPERVYDGVILGSVLQYLDREADLDGVLEFLAVRLRRPSLGVIATDVVVGGSSRRRDGIDLVRALRSTLGWPATISTLARTAHQWPHPLTAWTEARIGTAATAAGFRATRLATNLSPLSQRATFVFDAAPSA